MGASLHRQDILQKLHDLAAQIAGCEGRRGDEGDDARDLSAVYGFSSLQAFEYLFALENEFGVTVDSVDLAREDLFVDEVLVATIERHRAA